MKAKLTNYEDIEIFFEIPVALIIMSRTDTAISYRADENQIQITLPELEV